jgi:hypothetical protein
MTTRNGSSKPDAGANTPVAGRTRAGRERRNLPASNSKEVRRCLQKNCQYIHDCASETLRGVNAHFRKSHPGIPKTQEQAAIFNCMVCPHCDQFVRFSKQNPAKPERHSNCPVQTQPLNPANSQTFAEESDRIREERRIDDIESTEFPQESSLPARPPRINTRTYLISTCREIAIAATSQDFQQCSILVQLMLTTFQDQRQTVRHPRKPPGEFDTISKAMSVLRASGRIGKSMDSLRALPLYVITPESSLAIIALYPPRRGPIEFPQDLFTNDEYSISIDTEVIKGVLRRKDRTVGRGPSGMGYGDLKSAAEKNEAFISDLKVVLEVIVNGRLPADSPAMQTLTDLDGKPLRKDTGKPRPIGVSEVILNTGIAAAVQQDTGDIKAALTDDDYGFRTKDGQLIPGMRANTLLGKAREENRQLVCIKVDIKNAFGTTPRNFILKTLLKKGLKRLARLFVVTHLRARNITFEGMDPIGQVEGIVQGDPAAPAYAQLAYSDICNVVRSALKPTLLGSYFDDIFIIDEFDTALECFLMLKNEFRELGMEVAPNKCLLYSTTPLSNTQSFTLAQATLPSSLDGLVLAGCPVGTDTFITNHLRRKVHDTMAIGEKLILVSQRARVDPIRWADPQGLYCLTRDSFNQLLRHLTRCIDPAIAIPELEPLDAQTLELTCSIFQIPQSQRSAVIKQRILFPTSMSGLGMRSYALDSPCAFAATVASLALKLAHELDGPFTSNGLACAREILQGMEIVDLIPSNNDLFDSTAHTPTVESQIADLSDKLVQAVRDKQFKDTWEIATLNERKFLSGTKTDRSGDFLRAPLTDRDNRIFYGYATFVKFYLGLPVTSALCNINSCSNRPVHQWGAHSHHVSGRQTARHHTIRDVLARFFSYLPTESKRLFQVTTEPSLEEMGYPKLTDARDAQARRGDIALRNQDNGVVDIIDVTVIHPKFDQNLPNELSHISNAPQIFSGQLEEAYEKKMNIYVKNYNVPKDNVIPFVMNSLGDIHPKSWDWLKTVIRGCAGEDDALYNKLLTKLKYRLATAQARGEAAILERLNRLNNYSPVVHELGHIDDATQTRVGEASDIDDDGAAQLESQDTATEDANQIETDEAEVETAQASPDQATSQRSSRTSTEHDEDEESNGASPGDSMHSEGEPSARNMGLFRVLRRFVIGSSNRRTGPRNAFLGRLGVRRETSNSNSPSMTTRLTTGRSATRSASKRSGSREALSDT